ncbi:MAG: prepilin peptidase [Candidatus Doudnabacteria bacterium]|nr:prepilin peptidase [Candidatus Doudnabacteria bacterium]
MDLILAIFIFIFGLMVGSFLNAVIFRLHTRESFLFERSHCPYCKHELAAKDLVPLFSFLALQGKCRYCRKPISWQYPFIELITAIIFVLLALNLEFGIWNLEFCYLLTVICFLIIVAVYDFKHYLILDKVVFPAFGLALLWSIVSGQFVSGLIGAAIVAGFFALQYYVSQGRWIGFGDVKLGLFLGTMLGYKMSLIMLLLAYFMGAVVGVTLIMLKQKTMGSKLPFGVFLSISAIMILLYGQQISDWYFKLIGLQ